jgi:hypothetical protein
MFISSKIKANSSTGRINFLSEQCGPHLSPDSNRDWDEKKEESMKTLDEAFERLYIQVKDECSSKGVRGVFAIGNLLTKQIRWEFVDIDNPLIAGDEIEKDVNLLGAVLNKFAMLVTYRENTGYPRGADVIGEVPWKGGLLGQSGEFGYCFSGGTQAEDLALVQNAELLHLSL